MTSRAKATFEHRPLLQQPEVPEDAAPMTCRRLTCRLGSRSTRELRHLISMAVAILGEQQTHEAVDLPDPDGV